MKTLMLAAIRCSLMFTAVAALSIVYPTSVQAVPTTYQYTGNPFTDVSGPYTTSDFVSGMVTLAAPLAPNMSLTTVSPISSTFSDGFQTLTTGPLIRFATGPTGAIVAWNVLVGFQFHMISTINVPGDVRDVGIYHLLIGQVTNNPGTWTVVGAVPDTGSTLSLMTLTLMALGVAARQFKRAAACPRQGLAEVAS